MTSIIYDHSALKKAARLQEGGDDHYAPDVHVVDQAKPHLAFGIWPMRDEQPVASAPHPLFPKHIDAEWVTGTVAGGIDDGSAHHTHSLGSHTHSLDYVAHGGTVSEVLISERLRSIMTNAQTQRGTPDHRAAALLSLLEEHGLKIVERD